MRLCFSGQSLGHWTQCGRKLSEKSALPLGKALPALPFNVHFRCGHEEKYVMRFGPEEREIQELWRRWKKKKRTGPEIRTRDHWLSFAVLNFISPAQQDLVLAPELRPCVSHTLLFQTGICSAVVLFLLYHSILYVSESKKVVMTHTTLSETSCKVGALF